MSNTTTSSPRDISIIIPARYGSSRLPGKPLIQIAGKSMLSRVVELAQHAVSQASSPHQIKIYVATDDARIARHCDEIHIPHIMTPESCVTGTDRVHDAMQMLTHPVDYIVNLQGDAPFTPPAYITALLKAINFAINKVQMLTCVQALSFEALDTLRVNKKTTPMSGTTVIMDKNAKAIWFSKQIIPAIRNESTLRATQKYSPVFKHFGLYAYSRQLLQQFVSWEPSHYEMLEGLEQLRVLENGYDIQCVHMPQLNYPMMSGIDSPEDVERAEQLIAEQGEMLDALNGVFA